MSYGFHSKLSVYNKLDINIFCFQVIEGSPGPGSPRPRPWEALHSKKGQVTRETCSSPRAQPLGCRSFW